MPEPVESPGPTEEQRAKWRKQFEKQGLDEVRRQMNAGATYFNASSRAEAKLWLRDKERTSDWRERWTFWSALAVLVLTILSFVMTLIEKLTT